MFPHNAQKKPFADSMNKFVEAKALAEIRKRGQSLPGHVVDVVSSMIVTVAFNVEGALPIVTMPVFGPEYLRYPIQVGDLGVALSASVPIAAVSGLGAGPAPDLTTLNGNLSMLTWFPVGNTDWAAVDLNTLVLYGPPDGNGVLLQDFILAPGATLSVKNGAITLSAGGHTLAISNAGIVLDGIVFGTHEHSGVESGSDQSAGPTNP